MRLSNARGIKERRDAMMDLWIKSQNKSVFARVSGVYIEETKYFKESYQVLGINTEKEVSRNEKSVD